MKNIIVLTSGLSGSSVVTNLLSRAGVWSGHSTCKKSDYNTHENAALVALNERLLEHLAYAEDYSSVVKPEMLDQARGLIHVLDLSPFRAFIAECNKNQPWIWKDPRLWVTMPFWIQLLDSDSFQVVFVDRSVTQRWISELLRRNIQTFAYCSKYNNEIKRLVEDFIADHQLACCAVLFDDLLAKPENTLAVLNEFFGCHLTLSDLMAVYHKPLYQKARGWRDALLALMIYIKNYKVRLK